MVGTWAGLRPLVKAATSGRTADLSRRHRVTRSDVRASSPSPAASSPPTGRWPRTPSTSWSSTSTGLPRSARRSRTAKLKVRGAQAVDPKATGLTRHLADRYGTEARVLHALIDEDPSLGEPLVPGLPYVRAEAVYAVRHEMATTVDDVLARRTRARLQAREASAAGRRATSPRSWRPSSGGRATRPPSQADAYVALVDRRAGRTPALLTTGEVPA